VSGKANVYDFDSAGKVVIKTPDAPYTTRILVRRPAAASKFSGNVIVELLNPSLLFDWDPQWMFSNGYFMEHGDIWVGVTVNPLFSPISWKRLSPCGIKSLIRTNCATLRRQPYGYRVYSNPA
jgi:hypothetical protein